MIEFRVSEHSIKGGQMIEIFQKDTGILLGAIYPADWGIRIMSKYLKEDSVHRSALVVEIKLP